MILTILTVLALWALQVSYSREQRAKRLVKVTQYIPEYTPPPSPTSPMDNQQAIPAERNAA